MQLLKEIWLIRHGESQAQNGESEDGVDPPLNALGERQALALGERLRDEYFDRVYLSPLLRTVRTCELSAPRTERLTRDSRVAEIPGGPGWYARRPPPNHPGPGEADSHHAWLIDPQQRVAELVEEICAGPERRVLVYGHQGIFRYFFQAYTGLGGELDGNALPLLSDNAGIHQLEIHAPDQRYLRCWNDHRHLAGGLLNNRNP